MWREDDHWTQRSSASVHGECMHTIKSVLLLCTVHCSEKVCTYTSSHST